MIFPNNGQVVVFDDNPDEVKDLFKALSIHKIPFVYYQDEAGEDLPEKPLEGVRIIILDLQLFTSGVVSEKNVIASIAIRLERVLQKDHGYLLLYWSTKEDKYVEILNKAFETDLSAFKPILQLSLNKSEAMSDPHKTFDYVKDKLIVEIARVDVLQAFMQWENLMSASTSKLVTEFFNLVPRDEKWNDNLKSILERLAIAYSGKRALQPDYSANNKLSDAFFTLNQIHIDNIEQAVKLHEDTFDANGLFNNQIKDEDVYCHKINSKLLIADGSDRGLIPGSIFFIDSELESKEKDILYRFDNWVNNEEIPAEIKEKHIEKKKKEMDRKISDLNSQLESNEKIYNEILYPCLQETERGDLKEILRESIKVELNISPLCDYAQNKLPLCRLLRGLMIKDSYREKLIKSNVSLYISDVPITFNECNFYFVFDFKFLFSVEEKFIRMRSSPIKLRHQLLADIQVKLGNHVNRPGVLYIPTN